MTQKTIFIRCSEETNSLLDKIRKSEMPHKSRNSQIIYLIHQEANRLNISSEPKDEPKQDIVGFDANGSPTTESVEGVRKLGLEGLVEKVKQGSQD